MALLAQKVILTLLLISCVAWTTEGFLQTMSLEYNSGETLDGDQFACTSTFRSKVADASSLNIGNISRICYQGFWTLYAQPNFMSKPSYNFYMNQSCFDRATFNYSSFRYNGVKDTSQDSISFYPETFWQGPETTVTGPAHGGMTPGFSVVVTGKTKWTVFPGQDFDGEPKCAGLYTSPNWDMDYWSDVPINFSMSKGIGSVIRGCDPAVVAEIQAKARSGQKFY